VERRLVGAQVTRERSIVLAASLALGCVRDEAADAADAATGDDVGEGTCEDVTASDQVGPEVTIALVNTGADPVYVANLGYCSFDAFEILDPEGQAIRWHRSTDCEPACSDPAGECIQCVGQGPCNFPAGPIMIAPSGRYEVKWPSMILESVPLPGGCPTGQGCAGSCSLGSPPPAGEYTLRAMASGSFGCDLPEPELCMCMPNAEGWCSLGEYGSVIDPVAAQGLLDYPNQVVVEIEF
jgi:hypothetical protein